MTESRVSNHKRLRNSSISSKKNPKIKVRKAERKKVEAPENRESEYFISEIKSKKSHCPTHSKKSIEKMYSRRENK